MTIRSLARTLLSVLALVAVLAACGDSDDDGAPAEDQTGGTDAITLMLNWTPNAHHAGIYRAIEAGYLADEGLDVTVVEPNYEVGVEAAVASGAAEIGIAQAESLLPARAAGVDVVAIATLLPTNDSVLMGLADEGIDGPASLEGLTYGGFGGALETELISGLVACDGGDPAAVEQVEVGNVDYLAGMEQDRFDVVWVFGGWDVVRATEVAGVEVDTIAFADHLDCIPDWYTPLLLTSPELAAEGPDGVAGRFLAAVTRGYADVIADPSTGTEALLAAAPELDAELVEAAVEYYAPRFAPDAPFGTMEAEVWQRFAEFLVQAGLLDEVGDVDAAWTDELLG